MLNDEVSEFALKLKEMGEKNKIKTIVKYAEELYDASENFDIVKMTKLMKEFEEIKR